MESKCLLHYLSPNRSALLLFCRRDRRIYGRRKFNQSIIFHAYNRNEWETECKLNPQLSLTSLLHWLGPLS